MGGVFAYTPPKRRGRGGGELHLGLVRSEPISWVHPSFRRGPDRRGDPPEIGPIATRSPPASRQRPSGTG